LDIQTYSPDRAKDIADLFHQSVHAIDSALYTTEQKEAWAPSPVNYRVWAERLSESQPFLALIDHSVAGFIELDPKGYIDCLYTHPDFQGRGVASNLFSFALGHAKKRNIERLFTDASFPAKPFFERRGFSVIRQNTVQRNGVSLINFSMELFLNADMER